jgi:hypothetical protein
MAFAGQRVAYARSREVRTTRRVEWHSMAKSTIHTSKCQVQFQICCWRVVEIEARVFISHFPYGRPVVPFHSSLLKEVFTSFGNSFNGFFHEGFFRRSQCGAVRLIHREAAGCFMLQSLRG